MKKRFFYCIIASIIILLGYYSYSNYIPYNQILGTYIYNNQNNLPTFPDAPIYPDTLHLLENGIFISNSWGKGNYKVRYMLGKTEIDFLFGKDNCKGGYSTHIEKNIGGSLKIMISNDLKLYFNKIEQGKR